MITFGLIGAVVVLVVGALIWFKVKVINDNT